MAWFDDPAEYYREPGHESDPVSQGDILIGPTAVIVGGTGDVDVAAPKDLDAVRLITLWRGAEAPSLPEAPSLSANVRWGPVMVLPHACALEKEWNERLEELQAAGETLEHAQELASAETDLDKYVVIAPVVGYDDLSPRAIEATKRGERVGAFPIARSDLFSDVFVDFNQLTTVEWRLVPRAYRVASLSDLAVGHLRHRLCTFYAHRTRSRLGDIEAAIGRRIVGVNLVKGGSRRLTVGFVLDNGETLTLQGEPGTAPPPGPERPART